MDVFFGKCPFFIGALAIAQFYLIWFFKLRCFSIVTLLFQLLRCFSIVAQRLHKFLLIHFRPSGDTDIFSLVVELFFCPFFVRPSFPTFFTCIGGIRDTCRFFFAVSLVPQGFVLVLIFYARYIHSLKFIPFRGDLFC